MLLARQAFSISNGPPGTVVALAPSPDWGDAVPPCLNTGGVSSDGQPLTIPCGPLLGAGFLGYKSTSPSGAVAVISVADSE